MLADSVTLTPISDGNAGTDDQGYASSETNATAFKDQSLVTVGNYQFTSYYGADQGLVLGRRNLATDPNTWFLLHTGLLSTDIADSHTVSTISIDGDGFLHAAWGLHDDPLRYTRSTTSVLNDNPFTVPGTLPNPITLQSGSSTSYSYPEFYSIPGSGDLLFAFRLGIPATASINWPGGIIRLIPGRRYTWSLVPETRIRALSRGSTTISTALRRRPT